MLFPNGLKTRPTVTSPYGWRIHPITGKRAFHYGTDSVNHPNGWNRAPEAGVVTFAGYNGGEGLSVHIRGATRLWKIFHHARIDVSVGQRVYEGTVTGPTGTTGASTGVHCHLECWSFGAVSQDPYAYIAANINTSPAGGGTEPFPNGRKKSMTTVYWNGQPGASGAKWALGGDSPGTTANWIETGTQSLASAWAKVHGDAVNLGSDSAFADFRSWYQQPVKTSGGQVEMGDITVTADNSELVAAVQALGAQLAAHIDALPAEIDRYADGKKQS